MKIHYYAPALGLLFASINLFANDDATSENTMLRVGIIGLDTSHVPSFTKSFNQDPADPEMQNCRVIAAYPKGSEDIPSSYERIPKYTQQVQDMGVEIVDSVDALLSKVDCVLLETNDGKPHLPQALQVFQAGKPVFIDKPIAQDLSHAVAIVRAAEHYHVPMFSSSSLRYIAGAQEVIDGMIGEVFGCDTYSPSKDESSHTDLFWYGIHGVEPLFTCLGTGCVSVQSTRNETADVVTGTWQGDRTGVFRGIRKGKTSYGGVAFGSTGIQPLGPYQGYQPLVKDIAKFFRTGFAPVSHKETLQIYAFMQAAHVSNRRGGARVTIAEVMKVAETRADELLEGKL